MLKYALVLAFLPAIVLAGRITFTPCTGGGPIPHWAEIDNCDETRCVVTNGGEVTFRASHTAELGAESLQTTVIGYVVVPIPLPLPDHVSDGCQTVAGGCPIAVGETRDFGSTFVIQSPLSNITPAVEYRVVNEAGQTFICVRTFIEVVG